VDTPFIFTRPLDPQELVDREREVAELLGELEGGVNVRLTSPRDYGKTSLLQRVLWEAERRGMATVLVDLYGARTPAQIAVLIERAYDAQLRSPLRRAFAALRRRGGGVGVQTPIGGGSIAVGNESAGQRDLLDLLDLPLRLHERSGKRFTVAFDEFQVVLASGEGTDGLIRSVIQHHGDAATYVFAGSHPGMMRELFADKRRPFYGQAAPVTLDRLPDEALADHIGDAFERSGREVGLALDGLLELVDGHPQRAMLMAHLLFRLTPRRSKATEETWADALEAAWPYLKDDFERTWDALSSLESGVVEAVAAATKGLTSADTRARFNLPSGSGAPRAAARLAERGLLVADERRPTRFRIVDPLFARWIAAGRRWR
jgi:uncharacterized protein